MKILSFLLSVLLAHSSVQASKADYAAAIKAATTEYNLLRASKEKLLEKALPKNKKDRARYMAAGDFPEAVYKNGEAIFSVEGKTLRIGVESVTGRRVTLLVNGEKFPLDYSKPFDLPSLEARMEKILRDRSVMSWLIPEARASLGAAAALVMGLVVGYRIVLWAYDNGEEAYLKEAHFLTEEVKRLESECSDGTAFKLLDSWQSIISYAQSYNASAMPRQVSVRSVDYCAPLHTKFNSDVATKYRNEHHHLCERHRAARVCFRNRVADAAVSRSKNAKKALKYDPQKDAFYPVELESTKAE